MSPLGPLGVVSSLLLPLRPPGVHCRCVFHDLKVLSHEQRKPGAITCLEIKQFLSNSTYTARGSRVTHRESLEYHTQIINLNVKLVFNRPSVAGAVLKIASSLTD